MDLGCSSIGSTSTAWRTSRQLTCLINIYDCFTHNLLSSGGSEASDLASEPHGVLPGEEDAENLYSIS